MSGDFRVALDFLDHPKTVKLKSVVGAEGVFCLMRLWAFAGNYRPRGLLSRMRSPDIAIAAKWTGDADLFLTALIDSRFLDKLKNGVYRLHNWKLRQGYLYHKPERQERARKGGKARQAKVDNDLRSAKNTNKHTPSPSPSPSPKIQSSPSAPVSPKKKKEKKETDPRMTLFKDYWMEDYGKVFPGEKYLHKGGKDAQATKTLLGSAELKDIQAAASWFLRYDGSDWLGQQPKEINRLAMNYNDIRQRMLAEKGSKVLQPGDPGYVPQ